MELRIDAEDKIAEVLSTAGIDSRIEIMGRLAQQVMICTRGDAEVRLDVGRCTRISEDPLEVYAMTWQGPITAPASRRFSQRRRDRKLLQDVTVALRDYRIDLE
jgi:hypothetical protein